MKVVDGCLDGGVQEEGGGDLERTGLPGPPLMVVATTLPVTPAAPGLAYRRRMR